MTSVAIVTGVTGQDGSYLVEFLLDKGYTVFGIVRRTTFQLCNSNLTSDSLLNPKFKTFTADLIDQSSLLKVFEAARDFNRIEVYNLAAQSHVGVSFDCPMSTAEINFMGTLNLLETIKQFGLIPKTRFYQASTSEMFGKVQQVPQNESTSFYPRSPYGVAKLAAHWMMVNYRESYGLFACSGILFNHESPRRGINFVTQKIVQCLRKCSEPYLEIGNLEAKRDWGHAKDYVRAMWLMLQQDTPDDYVVSSGEQHSVREFIELVSTEPIVWEGSGLDEVGRGATSGKILVRINPAFYRPCEVDTLLGDSSKMRSIGWVPEYSFQELVKNMCE
jgi:GDPmannose 4,6-dehydratase